MVTRSVSEGKFAIQCIPRLRFGLLWPDAILEPKIDKARTPDATVYHADRRVAGVRLPE